MEKPRTHDGYDPHITESCERVLVTLLRKLGPYADSVVLIGGLAPRYIVRKRPPEVAAHAGTGDIDMVIDQALLADTEAYRTLEEDLKRIGFERGVNPEGIPVGWRWTIRIDKRTTLHLELLTDQAESTNRRAKLLESGNVSALPIPHAALALAFQNQRKVTAELLDEGGRATVTVRHANVVSEVCLKAFAFADRCEPKDAHDLVYCLEFADGGPEAAAAAFRDAIASEHRPAIEEALTLVATHFADDETGEGYRKDGPTAVAKFESNQAEGDGARDRRVLRQREASEVVMRFLTGVRQTTLP